MKKLAISLLMTLPLSVHAEDFGADINKRQNAFDNIETISEQVEYTMDGQDTDWAKLETQSKSLATYSDSLLALFPQGSHSGDTKAKLEIWSKPQKFNQLLQQMDKGFQDLYQASQLKDIQMAEAALESAQDTCRGCHRSYRSRF